MVLQFIAYRMSLGVELPEAVVDLIFSKLADVRTILRFSAVNKHFYHHAAGAAKFNLVECDLDDGRAFQWICAHADQIKRININAQKVPHVDVQTNHGLLGEIHKMLAHDMPQAIRLARLHVVAPKKVQDALIRTGWSMYLKGDYDYDYDSHGAGASFAWSCLGIPTGFRGQLIISVHLWQPSGSDECGIRLDVNRRSNRDLLGRTWQVQARIDADWHQVATTLHEQVVQFEDHPTETDDEEDEDEEEGGAPQCPTS